MYTNTLISKRQKTERERFSLTFSYFQLAIRIGSPMEFLQQNWNSLYHTTTHFRQRYNRPNWMHIYDSCMVVDTTFWSRACYSTTLLLPQRTSWKPAFFYIIGAIAYWPYTIGGCMKQSSPTVGYTDQSILHLDKNPVSVLVDFNFFPYKIA